MLKQHTKAKRTNHSRTTRLTRDLQQFPVKIMEDFGHNQKKYQWMNVKLEEHQIAPCYAFNLSATHFLDTDTSQAVFHFGFVALASSKTYS